MLYLAIDQHKNCLTINIRNEQGDVLQKGQVSSKPADIDEFFIALAKKARKHCGYYNNLREFVSRRVHDGVLRRFIGKWPKTGVLEGSELSSLKLAHRRGE